MNTKTVHDDDDDRFCDRLPKLECHAHLNGSIPRETFRHLRAEAISRHPELALSEFPFGCQSIDRFFRAFQDDIYKVTDTPSAISYATESVLKSFEKDGCVYLELRTTPRTSSFMNMEEYLEAVLGVIEAFDQEKMLIRLILSVDWKHQQHEALSIVDLGARFRNRGVVGIDVCGNPILSEKFQQLIPALTRAREMGLKITLHFAEIASQQPYLIQHLEGFQPDRLGHATFLSTMAQHYVVERKLPIEICISSNIKCGTVASIEAHHFKWALEHYIPVLISESDTDDVLVFDNSSSQEYSIALQLLKGKRSHLIQLVKVGIEHIFGSTEDKLWLNQKLNAFQSTEEKQDVLS
ncbi:hypothetical protein CROQUDRAFT_88334 [Cronartium quercuum f. sp. fusiforme G11]|uniref:Adenosine deaminase domain-containing protein n=1 Tax=Cronartium quercuum f. sp. fusiforme G11 TaxID=708437 RepID=A0A9P6NV10_9BASI|nr:hypothetical protein CROQUDRAFT_88334 [Cronartium quercuum f. sp. fusiforme G11]